MEHSVVNGDKLLHNLPLILYLFVLSVVGITGNSFAFLFYGCSHTKMTSPILLMSCLSAVDLLNSFIILVDISQLIVDYFNNRMFACKILTFVYHICLALSLTIVWSIAIDWYNKVCSPFAKPYTIKQTVIAIASLISLSSVLSVHYLLTYDTVPSHKTVNMTMNISEKGISTNALSEGFSRNFSGDGHFQNLSHNQTTVISHVCTVSNKPGMEIIVNVFYIIDYVVCIIIFTTIVFTYGNIIHTLKKQHGLISGKGGASHSKGPKATGVSFSSRSNGSKATDIGFSLRSTGSKVTDESVASHGKGSKVADVSDVSHIKNSMISCVSVIDCRKDNISGYQRSISARNTRIENNLTRMTGIVSVGLLLCLMPYFIVSVGGFIKEAEYGELHVSIEILYRSPYVSSVINPIIFGLFHPPFQRYIMSTIVRCRIQP